MVKTLAWRPSFVSISRMALESPTFAVTMVSGVTHKKTPVDPLRVELMRVFLVRVLSSFKQNYFISLGISSRLTLYDFRVTLITLLKGLIEVWGHTSPLFLRARYFLSCPLL